jgi:uncharacterized membrane protein YbaN (DUF454 family)
LKLILFQLLGWLFLSLAIIGAFLPVLPTTPFALLALYFFGQSSPRMAQWILTHRYLGPPIQRWKRNKTIAPKVKRMALTVLSTSMLISLYVTKDLLWLTVLLCCVWLVLSFFLWRIPTKVSTIEGQDKAKI